MSGTAPADVLCCCMHGTVADELEEAFRSHIWDPSLRHVRKQKQGINAARVELTSLFTTVHKDVAWHNMLLRLRA